MEGEPLFPVVVKDAAFRPPDAAAYYVLARDGVYLVRRTDLFAASMRVDGGVPGLLPHHTALALALPRIPRLLVEQAVGFFRAVYDRLGGEAILVVFYRPPAPGRPGRFALGAPPQRVRGRFERGRFRAELHLDYGTCERPEPGFREIGTVHSHADLGPTHSLVDEHDERGAPGLHVTIGYVHTVVPAFAAAWVAGGTRFALAPEDVLEPFERVRRWPAFWMRQLTVVCEPIRAWCVDG